MTKTTTEESKTGANTDPSRWTFSQPLFPGNESRVTGGHPDPDPHPHGASASTGSRNNDTSVNDHPSTRSALAPVTSRVIVNSPPHHQSINLGQDLPRSADIVDSVIPEFKSTIGKSQQEQKTGAVSSVLSKKSDAEGLSVNKKDNPNTVSTRAKQLNNKIFLIKDKYGNSKDIEKIEQTIAKTLELTDENLALDGLAKIQKILDQYQNNKIKQKKEKTFEGIKIPKAVGGGDNTDEYLFTNDDIDYLLSKQENNRVLVKKALLVNNGTTLLSETVSISLQYLQTNINTNAVMIPVNINNNHWVALVIKREGDKITFLYNDPLGNTMDVRIGNEIYTGFGTYLSVNESNFVLDKIKDFHLRQQDNGYDCGPFTVHNLIMMANADDINQIRLIELPMQSANMLREDYHQLIFKDTSIVKHPVNVANDFYNKINKKKFELVNQYSLMIEKLKKGQSLDDADQNVLNKISDRKISQNQLKRLSSGNNLEKLKKLLSNINLESLNNNEIAKKYNEIKKNKNEFLKLISEDRIEQSKKIAISFSEIGKCGINYCERLERAKQLGDEKDNKIVGKLNQLAKKVPSAPYSAVVLKGENLYIVQFENVAHEKSKLTPKKFEELASEELGQKVVVKELLYCKNEGDHPDTVALAAAIKEDNLKSMLAKATNKKPTPIYLGLAAFDRDGNSIDQIPASCAGCGSAIKVLNDNGYNINVGLYTPLNFPSNESYKIPSFIADDPKFMKDYLKYVKESIELLGLHLKMNQKQAYIQSSTREGKKKLEQERSKLIANLSNKDQETVKRINEDFKKNIDEMKQRAADEYHSFGVSEAFKQKIEEFVEYKLSCTIVEEFITDLAADQDKLDARENMLENIKALTEELDEYETCIKSKTQVELDTYFESIYRKFKSLDELINHKEDCIKSIGTLKTSFLNHNYENTYTKGIDSSKTVLTDFKKLYTLREERKEIAAEKSKIALLHERYELLEKKEKCQTKTKSELSSNIYINTVIEKIKPYLQTNDSLAPKTKDNFSGLFVKAKEIEELKDIGQLKIKIEEFTKHLEYTKKEAIGKTQDFLKPILNNWLEKLNEGEIYKQLLNQNTSTDTNDNSKDSEQQLDQNLETNKLKLEAAEVFLPSFSNEFKIINSEKLDIEKSIGNTNTQKANILKLKAALVKADCQINVLQGRLELSEDSKNDKETSEKDQNNKEKVIAKEFKEDEIKMCHDIEHENSEFVKRVETIAQIRRNDIELYDSLKLAFGGLAELIEEIDISSILTGTVQHFSNNEDY